VDRRQRLGSPCLETHRKSAYPKRWSPVSTLTYTARVSASGAGVKPISYVCQEIGQVIGG